MLKLTPPEEDDFYLDLVKHPNVLQVVALSGGYSRDEANARLARNHGVVASFSRALTAGLSAQQSAGRVRRRAGCFDREHLPGIHHLSRLTATPFSSATTLGSRAAGRAFSPRASRRGRSWHVSPSRVASFE